MGFEMVQNCKMKVHLLFLILRCLGFENAINKAGVAFRYNEITFYRLLKVKQK